VAPAALQLSITGHTTLAAAQIEATTLGHDYLGSEHLLLALLSEPLEPLAQLLGARGFSLVEARARVRWLLEYGPKNPMPYISPQSV
jgi:ATP-dependent Clp protease ATP-binding subunit ClpA